MSLHVCTSFYRDLSPQDALYLTIPYNTTAPLAAIWSTALRLRLFLFAVSLAHSLSHVDEYLFLSSLLTVSISSHPHCWSSSDRDFIAVAIPRSCACARYVPRTDLTRPVSPPLVYQKNPSSKPLPSMPLSLSPHPSPFSPFPQTRCSARSLRSSGSSLGHLDFGIIFCFCP